MIRTTWMTAAALVLSLALPASASATFLGSTLNYQYYYPNLASPYANADNGNKLVGPGVEISNMVDNRGPMDISASNIYIDFVSASSFSSAAFNGWVLTDIFDTVAPITGVSVNAATNMSGFGVSNIAFTADSISVNFQSLPFDAKTIVSLDVQFGQAVPEPLTMVLAGIGLLGIVVVRRGGARICTD